MTDKDTGAVPEDGRVPEDGAVPEHRQVDDTTERPVDRIEADFGLSGLFDSLTADPPESRLSPLGVMSRAKRLEREKRGRRHKWVLGSAAGIAAVVLLGFTGKALFKDGFGGSDAASAQAGTHVEAGLVLGNGSWSATEQSEVGTADTADGADVRESAAAETSAASAGTIEQSTADSGNAFTGVGGITEFQLYALTQTPLPHSGTINFSSGDCVAPLLGKAALDQLTAALPAGVDRTSAGQAYVDCDLVGATQGVSFTVAAGGVLPAGELRLVALTDPASAKVFLDAPILVPDSLTVSSGPVATSSAGQGLEPRFLSKASSGAAVQSWVDPLGERVTAVAGTAMPGQEATTAASAPDTVATGESTTNLDASHRQSYLPLKLSAGQISSLSAADQELLRLNGVLMAALE